MGPIRSPFLTGALAWIYDGALPERCPTCGYDWSFAAGEAREMIAAAPGRYARLLAQRDGMSPAADGGWNATGYLWHLVDLARSWSERWVQVRARPGDLLAGWDPNELAEARNYRSLPTVSALWAIDDAVATFLQQCDDIALDTPFTHGDWGVGTVEDGIRWLAHEFVHHQLDVDARAADR